MHILFVCPYPHNEAPSQRFRFEQYFSILKQNNHNYHQAPFYNLKTWRNLYTHGGFLIKIIGIIKGFTGRFLLLFTLKKYDIIFIHREAEPIGPPWFTWFISTFTNKKIIYDFDDAIWIPGTPGSNKIMKILRWHNNVKYTIKKAYKVSAGNDFLANYSKLFNTNVFIIPTSIDTDSLHNKTQVFNSEKLTIGWTGSHSTMQYLKILNPIILNLKKAFDFNFLVISNQKPELDFDFEYRKWDKKTEIEDLMEMHIGVMPLNEDKWANGKCGFKALQYLALGIPALVSPIGVNSKIVCNGENGFLCANTDEWRKNLELLLTNKELLIKMAKNAQKTVINHYSIQANTQRFLHLLR